jgi:hypothetical protein
MGASTTFGGGLVDWREVYPARLQGEHFARGLGHVRVVNAGVSGYTSWETLANHQFRVSDLEPDLVIVYHAANDIVARLTWPPEAYLSDNSAFRSPASQVHWPALYEHSDALRIVAIEAGLLVPHSRLDRLFGDRAEWHVGSRAFDDDLLRRVLAANPLRCIRRNLGRLARAVHDDGARVLLPDLRALQRPSRPAREQQSRLRRGLRRDEREPARRRHRDRLEPLRPRRRVPRRPRALPRSRAQERRGLRPHGPLGRRRAGATGLSPSVAGAAPAATATSGRWGQDRRWE